MVLPAFAPAAPYVVPTTMLDVVKHLGLPSPKLCLDAGDINSVASGSQTKWLDVSGNGYDFFRGTDATSQATDPTFNGTPGGQGSSEFYGFDGGDFFTYDSANETWMNNLHKDGATWAFAFWLYVAALPGSAAVLFGNDDSTATNVGVSVFVRAAGTLRVAVANANGLASGALVLTSSASVNTNAWNFLACQINESAGTGFLQVNGAQEDQATTYSSPSSSSATRTLEIGRDGTGSPGGTLPSAYRISSCSMWESAAPAKNQMLSLQVASKGKLGL